MSEIPKVDRQREHQANERTFLAWLRTAVSLIGFGLAIARFGLFLNQLQVTVAPGALLQRQFFNSQNIGVSLVIAGILIILLAVWRYNRVFWQIEQADYQPNRLLVWLTAGIVLILGLLSIPFVLWQPLPPSSPPQDDLSRYKKPDRQIICLTYRVKNLANSRFFS